MLKETVLSADRDLVKANMFVFRDITGALSGIVSFLLDEKIVSDESDDSDENEDSEVGDSEEDSSSSSVESSTIDLR